MRARKLITLAILFLLASAPGNAGRAEEKPENDWISLYEPQTYNEMPYRLMKPIRFDASKRYPLIVSLHGGGGRGTDNRK